MLIPSIIQLYLSICSIKIVQASFIAPQRPLVKHNVGLFLTGNSQEDSSRNSDSKSISRREAGNLAGLWLGASCFPAVVAASDSVAVAVKEKANAVYDDLPITHEVFFDVRISRPDGTFYVKDVEEEDPNDRVFRGRLTLGLYGTVAPVSVENFLSYVNVKNDPLDESPLPSYGRSTFPALDDAVGLLACGNIPGLDETSFNGGAALRYRERIISPKLWVESSSDVKLSHSMKGLLTHRKLDLLPRFGITTYSDSRQFLDSDYQVFGKVKMDDDAKEFFNRIERLPKYSLERPSGSSTSQSDNNDNPSAVIASKIAADVFEKQNKFFRGAAKSFGDSRIDKVYAGKFLRRVDVTQVGMLT